MKRFNLRFAVFMKMFVVMFAALVATAPVYAQAAENTEAGKNQQQPPAGFSAAEEEEVTFVKPAAGDDERFWAAVRKLTRTLHNEDMEGYLSLFSKRLLAREKGSLESAIGFMSGAMAVRGGIAKFHDVSAEAIQAQDTAFPVRSVIFHMEDGTSGYFALSLDEADKIDHYSFFIKRDLCSEGKRCDKATFAAEEEH